MQFNEFISKKKEDEVAVQHEKTQARVKSMFKENANITSDLISKKTKEFGMSKDEMDNHVYDILHTFIECENKKTPLKEDVEVLEDLI